MNNISIGRYVPYDTFIHRLDPRSKIISMILMMVMIFFTFGSTWTNLIMYIIFFIFIYIIMLISKVSLRQLFKQLKMMWLMILILFIINIFTIKESIFIYIPSVGNIDRFTIPGINFTIYIASFVNTFYIFVRL